MKSLFTLNSYHKDKIRLDNHWLWLTLALAFFLISVLSLAAFASGKTTRIFFYPKNLTDKLIGEPRLVKSHISTVKALRTYTEELLLGPVSQFENNFLSSTARVEAVFVKNNVVLVDFSKELAVFEAGSEFKLDKMTKYLKKNLQFNFPWVKDVQIYIGGQLAGSPFHTDGLYQK